MNENELVSVILPVYNAEKFLYEAIDSIIRQTYKNLQIIIINDGSTDRSLDIINSFDDKRILIITRENKGLIYTLNEGLHLSKGSYIARMDADDIARFDRIEKQLRFLKKNKNVAIVGSYANLIDEDGNDIGLKKKPHSDKIIKAICFFGSPFIHPSVMFNKNLIKEELYYSNNFVHAEDYELWARLIANEELNFFNIKDTLLKYRIVSTSVSRKYEDQQKKSHENITKKYFLKKSDNSSLDTTLSLLKNIIFNQKKKSKVPLQIIYVLRKMIKNFR
ncbi:glycosyltransferase [Providencia sp. PROV197]|uniref:glycosyltransferase n=1 Tax=Providencia sp. PROV197 TaxID=2949898 RepID=UPI00234A290B|nr:glycosyltransferase [Providencia sp. PROV197]